MKTIKTLAELEYCHSKGMRICFAETGEEIDLDDYRYFEVKDLVSGKELSAKPRIETLHEHACEEADVPNIWLRSASGQLRISNSVFRFTGSTITGEVQEAVVTSINHGDLSSGRFHER